MSTHYVDSGAQQFEKTLVGGGIDELNELKAFLFKENIRLELQRKEIEELKQEIIEERRRLQEESDEVHQKILSERKRLKQEELFYTKKLEILKNGFQSLEADRKALEAARKQFERDQLEFSGSVRRVQDLDSAAVLFQGVSSFMSLKKRYKDLLKIYHPDNMNGDHEMVLTINQMYEELKKSYENSKIV
ncbi:MAG: hypothetical protein K6F53_06720 [Lachnospiraceae bacterium]|nr:hypothetical protein [Lachnospiraceae bacterium]